MTGDRAGCAGEQVSARRDAEGDLADASVWFHRQIDDAEQDPVGHRALASLRRRQLGADHHLGELFGGHRRGVVDLTNGLAGADDRDRVGVLEDLVELVGDEDHRRLAGRQFAQRGEQFVDLVGDEHGRGLVEDQDLGTAVEHLEDLDALLLADAEVGHQLVGIDLQSVAAAEGANPAAGGVSGEHRPTRFAARARCSPTP